MVGTCYGTYCPVYVIAKPLESHWAWLKWQVNPQEKPNRVVSYTAQTLQVLLAKIKRRCFISTLVSEPTMLDSRLPNSCWRRCVNLPNFSKPWSQSEPWMSSSWFTAVSEWVVTPVMIPLSLHTLLITGVRFQLITHLLVPVNHQELVDYKAMNICCEDWPSLQSLRVQSLLNFKFLHQHYHLKTH